MKNAEKWLLYVAALLFCQYLFAQQAKKAGKLEIQHLSGDFYVYTTYGLVDGSPYPSNSMYLVTGAGVVLFDTPWDSSQLSPLLDSIEKRHHQQVIMAIATHYHEDRTAGLNFLKTQNIKTFSSKQTRELCEKYNKETAAYTFLKDTVFHIGNHSFETYYPGEGHTKDNIVLWFPDEKIVYGGCLVKSTAVNDLGNIADANLAEWPKTINRLINKYPAAAYIIPGHLEWKDKQSLAHTLWLLKHLKK